MISYMAFIVGIFYKYSILCNRLHSVSNRICTEIMAFWPADDTKIYFHELKVFDIQKLVKNAFVGVWVNVEITLATITEFNK